MKAGGWLVPSPSSIEQGERMVKLPADIAVKILSLNETLRQRRTG
jgi:hypothetical protein